MHANAGVALRIEDYAIIGDTLTAALVGNDGSIDWLCAPTFSSDACFASLLGGPQHGRFAIAPAGEVRSTRRRYRPGTLVLETEMETEDGAIRITDCMPIREASTDVARRVECTRGAVDVSVVFSPRFGYGEVEPWLRKCANCVSALGGPDGLALTTEAPITCDDGSAHARFHLAKGHHADFYFSWHPSHLRPPAPLDVGEAIAECERYWRQWSSRCTYRGEWREEIVRSLITLKALTYRPTGGIVAAATTSLPERIGGVRNWDYRFVWLRDATFTLYSLMLAGYDEEARSFRSFLLRALAGGAEQFQIMYGVHGERRLTELDLPFLPGYEGSRPVRIGNAAVNQLQLDVYGELIDCLHQAEDHGIARDELTWNLDRRLLHFIEQRWREPDEGIWEVRGPRRNFTHSKVMAWVGMDRAIRSAEKMKIRDVPIDRWKALREEIHREICEKGIDPKRGCFTQYYGSKNVDASLLLIPLVGFLPPEDPRIGATIRAIEDELLRDGFVMRYTSDSSVDGLPRGEGAFLACSFWLADGYAMTGRMDDARAMFERIQGLRNDVGLFAEQFDPKEKRFTGNFPQAFSHVSHVNSAWNLSCDRGPAHRRAGEAAAKRER